MSITQTVDIPAGATPEGTRQLTIDVPPRVPAGRTILTVTPADEAEAEDDADSEEVEDETEFLKRDPVFAARLSKEIEEARKGVGLISFDTVEDLERYAAERQARRAADGQRTANRAAALCPESLRGSS